MSLLGGPACVVAHSLSHVRRLDEHTALNTGVTFPRNNNAIMNFGSLFFTEEAAPLLLSCLKPKVKSFV